MGRPKKFKNVEELQEVIERYKTHIDFEGRPPTIAGIAYYTGISRKTVYNYLEDDEFKPIIVDFVAWVLMKLEELAIEKGGAGVIFLLKNYGYTDKQKFEIEHDEIPVIHVVYE